MTHPDQRPAEILYEYVAPRAPEYVAMRHQEINDARRIAEVCPLVIWAGQSGDEAVIFSQTYC